MFTPHRLQRGILQHADFSGPQAPVLYDKPNHYAKGFTAEKGESFQGRHDQRMLFVFDEASGIAPIFWLTTKTMFKPGGMHAWLAILNPTDTSTQAFLEYSALDDWQPWKIIQMSCLDHPNIAAEIRGAKAPLFPPTGPTTFSMERSGCVPSRSVKLVGELETYL